MTPGHIARYGPKRNLKNPVKPRNVTIEQLIAAGCHLGHNKSLCHPAFKPLLSGLHGTTHIINLDYTIAHLRRAAAVIRDITFRHGIILIIGTRKGYKPIMVHAAERMEACLLFRKWIPGTLTNGVHVLHGSGVKAEPTPFRHYANAKVQDLLAAKDNTLWSGPSLKRWVWDRRIEQWVETDDQNVPEFRDWRGELRFGSKDPPEMIQKQLAEAKADEE